MKEKYPQSVMHDELNLELEEDLRIIEESKNSENPILWVERIEKKFPVLQKVIENNYIKEVRFTHTIKILGKSPITESDLINGYGWKIIYKDKKPIHLKKYNKNKSKTPIF